MFIILYPLFFFESAILDIFFSSFLFKSVTNYVVAWIRLNFLFARQKLGESRIMNSTVNYFGKNLGPSNSLMTSNLLICNI